MPSSIGAVQQQNIKLLDDIGEDKNMFEKVEGELEKFGALFLKNLSKSANNKKVVASGELLSKSKFVMVSKTKMEIWLPDYYDYPNLGVKGVKSSRNAPASPYKYKHYGMSAEGRANIKRYIESGHAKIKTVVKTNDKALGIGLEKKKLSLIDMQTNTLIYLIKRFGIKTTNYFTDAINETFGKEFELSLSNALEKDLVFTINKLNKK